MNRNQLYQLIISQLKDDGHHVAASFFQHLTMSITSDDIPKNRLANLIDQVSKNGDLISNKAMLPEDAFGETEKEMIIPAMEYDSLKENGILSLPNLKYCFKFNCKSSIKCCKIVEDRQLIAYATCKGDVEVVDIDKMMLSYLKGNQAPSRERIYKINIGEESITSLSLHPFKDILAVGTEKGSVILTNYGLTHSKLPFKSFHDVAEIRDLCWDVSGRYLYSSVDDRCIRIIDISSNDVYTPLITAIPDDYDVNAAGNTRGNEIFIHNKDGVTPMLIRPSPDGAYLLIMLSNGNVEIWGRILLKPISLLVYNTEAKDPVETLEVKTEQLEPDVIKSEVMDVKAELAAEGDQYESEKETTNSGKLPKQQDSMEFAGNRLLLARMKEGEVSLRNLGDIETVLMSFKLNNDDGKLLSATFSFDYSLLLVFTDLNYCIFVDPSSGKEISRHMFANDVIGRYVVSKTSSVIFACYGNEICVFTF